MCSVLQGAALAILDQFTIVDEWQYENMDELGIGFEGKLNDGAPPVEVGPDLDVSLSQARDGTPKPRQTYATRRRRATV